MSENSIKQILSDLLPYFEALEAQSSAILQLLRDKQIATDSELTRYLEQAGDASSVKWRAARVRMEHLFAVSSDPKGKAETETTQQKEVRRASDTSEARTEGAQPEKPRAAIAAKVTDQPSGSQEELRVSEAKKVPNQKSQNATAENSSAAEPDKAELEKIEPSNKTQKDAA